MRAAVGLVSLWSALTGCASVGCSGAGCGAAAERELKCPEGAVLIPAGTFTMGYDGYEGFGAGRPEHEVTLTQSYCMDRTEVTQKAFYECVASGKCDFPGEKSRYREVMATQEPNWPADFVNWNVSQAFCEAQGGRLPTEAEWEFAARGTDGRVYPWGNEPPTEAHWEHRAPGARTKTGDVGSHPKGRSFFGLEDMAGNVSEWVSDHCYDKYRPQPTTDPKGPASPERGEPCRMARGPSWATPEGLPSAIMRYQIHPDTGDDQTGFRCAYDPE